MAKTSLAFVFALLLALPIHSVFANEVNPLNLFDGVEAPVEAKTFDWVLEAKIHWAEETWIVNLFISPLPKPIAEAL
ncbi:hypothetical protein AHAS_Ahas03G0390500 [Arachis hypogaea]